MHYLRFSNRLALAATLALGLSAVHSAAAQTSIIGFTQNATGVEDNAADTTGSPGNSTGAGVPASYSLGFEFTANSNVFVTSLGYYTDPGYAGANFVNLSPAQSGAPSYDESHEVGLYQVIAATGIVPATVVQIASATVGNGSTRSGDFGYTQITAPVALVAGGDYVLAGVSGADDPYVYDVQDYSQPNNSGLTVDPAISYTQDRYAGSATLVYPTLTDPNSEAGFFGPNLQFTNNLPVSAAPEPSQFTILGLAALGLGTFILRVRRQAAARMQ